MTHQHAASVSDAHAPGQTHGAGLAVGKQTLVEQLPRDEHGSAPVVVSELPRAPAGEGRPLPATVRTRMERAFGADLSDVRVHEGDHVARMQAQAYAQGANLHFAPGQFDPNSEAGLELIGHELAHVIQQREGRAAVAQHKGGVIVDAGLEREADDLGHRAARSEVVARPGASRSLPAGAAGLGIQGNFVAGSSYQVMTLIGAAAYDDTGTKVTLQGNFLCTAQITGGFEVMSYTDAKKYRVPATDAANRLVWGTYAPPKGSPDYLPPVGPQQQHARVSGKTSNKQHYDAKGGKATAKASAHQLDKFSMPAKRGTQGGMERSGFESVDKANLLPSTSKFMDPDAKSTGANREMLFQRAEAEGMVEDVDHKSLVGGTDTTQGATYCAYCLKWFEGPALDADHVMTWKAIGEWFDTMLVKMNDPVRGKTFVAAVRLRFEAQKVPFEKHFTQHPFDVQKPWVASEMGAYYMFNNVKNLALSCKVCNQLEKNDMEWKDHLGKHAYFATDFMAKLAPGDDAAPVRSDGKYVAETMHEFNRTDPGSAQAIKSNRTVFAQSHARTNRNGRALTATRKQEWDKADALIDKEEAIKRTVDTLADEWESDGEEHASEKRRFIEIGIEDALYFSDKNLEFDPRAMLRENAQLIEELDDARDHNRQLERRLRREQARRREVEGEWQASNREADRLTVENDQLRQQLDQQRVQLQQQHAQMMHQMHQMQMMQHLQLQQLHAHGGQPPIPGMQQAPQPAPLQPPHQAPLQPPQQFGAPLQGPLQPPIWPQQQALWPQHQQAQATWPPTGGTSAMQLDQ